MNMLGNFGKFVITSLLLFAFVGVGYFVGQQGGSPDFVSSAHAFPANLPWESASSGKQLSMATGRIEEGVEGVFALDHLTGDLFCWYLNPRDGSLARSAPVNVATYFNVDGDSDYVMCTGLLNVRGGRSGGDRLANSVVYVGEGNSGKVAAFSIFYGSAGLRIEIIPGSRGMMTRDPRAIRDQGNSK